MSELTLDEGHVYRYGGRVVPGVTEALSIVNDLSFIDPERLEAAREFGAHVHLATDLFDKGELDEESLDADLIPYLGAYKQFLFESGFKVLTSEQRVYHPKLGYAGTLDKVGTLRNSVCLVDVKTGVYLPGYVGPQTAAYREALEEKPRRRFCLQLKRNTYRLFEQTDPSDWSMFISCLNVIRYTHKRKFSHVSEPA